MRDLLQEGSGSTTRRGVIAALLGGGVAAASLTPVGAAFERLAPLSGRAWAETGSTPSTVQSPHGPATITYDDQHVPHVEADSEEAAYFALGYVQAADRLFQMDLLRRRGSGRLAEVMGNFAVEMDVFVTKLDFQGAAEASREAIAGTDAETMTQAYADGVNAFREHGDPGVEFGILGYDPEPWDVLDTIFAALAMTQQQSLGFRTLRRSVLRRRLDDEQFSTLFPSQTGHSEPVLRDEETSGTTLGLNADDDPGRDQQSAADDPSFVDWLERFSGPEWAGSNCWVVSGEHTDHGEPIVCDDPHLPLNAPPIFYQQRVTSGDETIRGAAIPGTPFALVGENDQGAWGMTSALVDQIDFYRYDTDGDQYRYGDEWRPFETETQTVPVAGGEDRQVEVKKTVHGPYVEREIADEQYHVGISWVPLTGTRLVEALYGWNTAEGIEEFRDATRQFHVPPLNVHYADDAGNTLYQLAAKIPIRRVDGDVVQGDRIFDGSAGEGEWDGYEPYGQSSWSGFVPFEETPAAINPEYVASANQRITDDPTYPLAIEPRGGFRGERLYELLDQAAESDTTMDAEFMRSVQLDTIDGRARKLVPDVLDARERMPARVEPWLDALDEWNYGMDRDSEAALVFDRFVDHFRRETWQEYFDDRGLGRRYWPSEWSLSTLSADNEVFGGDRDAVLASAMAQAVDEIEAEGWSVYGAVNRAAIDHQLGTIATGLNYPRYATDGSTRAIRAMHGEDSGAAYRLIADLGSESFDVLAGGNDGSPYSDHYHDQLRQWADGEYNSMEGAPDSVPDVRVEEVQA